MSHLTSSVPASGLNQLVHLTDCDCSPSVTAPPTVGMVKQQTNESSEFTMSSEDFPALPGSQPERTNQSDQGMENSGSLAIGGTTASKQQKQGIQTHKDGEFPLCSAANVRGAAEMVAVLVRTAGMCVLIVLHD